MQKYRVTPPVLSGACFFFNDSSARMKCERSGRGQRRDWHRQRRERVTDVHLYASHAAVTLNSLADPPPLHPRCLSERNKEESAFPFLSFPLFLFSFPFSFSFHFSPSLFLFCSISFFLSFSLLFFILFFSFPFLSSSLVLFTPFFIFPFLCLLFFYPFLFHAVPLFLYFFPFLPFFFSH